MKHNKYAINDLYLFQFDGIDWTLINDETNELNELKEGLFYRVAPQDFNEDAFTVFEAEEDCIHMIENDRPYILRSVIEEFAQDYLVDRDNGGILSL